MTLDAGIARTRHIELRGVDDRCGAGLADVLAAWTMALLAPDVPFSDLLRLSVVVDRVTAVTERSGRTLHVPWGIERHPPIGIGLHRVRAPDLVRHVPLRGQREVIVAHFREVAL